MSIRLIARELYRLEREVEELERKIKEAPVEAQAELAQELRRAAAERDKFRGILASKKDLPLYRRPP
ncbi:MAG: hypothetical protein AB1641_22660 [Thermodesulfobacteriota bacterium]